MFPHIVKAIEKNWKFSKTKFHIFPQVVFSGLLLTCTPGGTVSIKHDPRWNYRLLSFPTLSCEEDIQSLLRVLGTLQLWLPNISLETEPFRNLLKKDTNFSWNQDM